MRACWVPQNPRNRGSRDARELWHELVFDILENFWVTDASPHRGGRDPKLTADRQKQPRL